MCMPPFFAIFRKRNNLSDFFFVASLGDAGLQNLVLLLKKMLQEKPILSFKS